MANNYTGIVGGVLSIYAYDIAMIYWVTQNSMENIYSGSYCYKLIFEGKSYPRSVNINKLYFKFIINNKMYNLFIHKT